MFYRQKVLLALIQCFQDELGNTDLEKLLFLYCKNTDKNHYDFFPYHYGAFSFTSYDDKQKLTKKGFLSNTKPLTVSVDKAFVDELEPNDRASMNVFARQFAGLRGRELIRHTYLKYPEYAARSKIAADVLSEGEYQIARKSWNSDTSRTLFTIGYEGISIDEYLFRLLSNNIRILIDVRMNPFSRKHGFSQNRLKAYVEKAGLTYYHLPELGIPSHLRKGLDDRDSYVSLFEHYTSEILPKQGLSLELIKNLVLQNCRVAITCFEADHFMCHRHMISLVLQQDSNTDFPIIHI